MSSSFTAERRAELLDELAPYRADAAATHPWAVGRRDRGGPAGAGGAVSRWSGGKNLAFEPLRPELVVEVGYDAMEGDRFRHTAQFMRWRPDRDPVVHVRPARTSDPLRRRRGTAVPP